MARADRMLALGQLICSLTMLACLVAEQPWQAIAGAALSTMTFAALRAARLR